MVRARSAAVSGKDLAAMPTWVEPMKAVLTAHVPEEANGWAFEIKWDGIRALAFCSPGSFRLLSRNKLDATFRYPEFAELGRAIAKQSAILDGEIIAIDEKGQPSFPLLQKRMNVTSKTAVDRAAREVPVNFVLFDVLWMNGRDLRGESWESRRENLESLGPLFPPSCKLSPVRVGGHKQGEDMLAAARERGLEGIMAKRTGSVYESGKRSPAWLKIKIVQRQELVVGGWVPQVSMDGRIKNYQVGAVLLGYYDKDGAFRYAGAVGTGFDARSSAEMVKRLKPLHLSKTVFVDPDARRFRADVQWVKPEVVIEAEYRRWPKNGRMQQAAFKGFREDKPARDVVREEAIE